MAVTKILARHARLDVLIHYALNGDKTEEGILTGYHNCTPHHPYLQMKRTKEETGKTGGVQGYHVIQSFAKGEISPELALRIAEEYVKECLPDYQAVTGVHVDREHVHAHIVFNSVNLYTGRKYHSNARSYYAQIRGISDRLCQAHGLSVILHGEKDKAVHYCEWLRQQKGWPTYRSMLEADLRRAIEDAGDYGHFLVLIENMGYEVKHGNRLSFRLRGAGKWYVPGRRDPLFTEKGIRNRIAGNMEEITTGLKPALPGRRYVPFKRHPKYTGFMALYVHYLYLLGKIQRQEFPPKMTGKMKNHVMQFEQYKTQFAFLREHGISTPEQLSAHKGAAEKKLSALVKQRTMLHVKKKRRKALFDALADAEALRPAKELYESGMTGMEEECRRYMDAVAILKAQGVSRETTAEEKSELYQALADVNREIREVRKEMDMCAQIAESAPAMERELQTIERNKILQRQKKQNRKAIDK